MRYIVASSCIGIMIVRAVWPEVRFDNISLSLLILAALAILLPELRGALGRVKKVKVPNIVEVEFAEKLKALAGRTEAVESRVAQQDRQLLVEEPRDTTVASWLMATGSDPRASLVLLAIEIEKTVRNVAIAADIPEARRPLLTRNLAVLAEQGVIDKQVVPLFRDFWAIRNSVVHGQHFELSEGKLYELLELGLRIVRLLRSGAGRVTKHPESAERE